MDTANVATDASATVQSLEIERLFRDHNAALLRFIAAKVGSRQEAREIAQEAYVHLLQLDRSSAISFLRAFLFKTAANLAIDRLRQRSRRSYLVSLPKLNVAVTELTPDRQLSGEQAVAVLNAALAQLPAKCRQAFLLHRVYEIRIEEIAERMGIGACMVRRYVARGLEFVQQRLDEAGQPQRGAKS